MKYNAKDINYAIFTLAYTLSETYEDYCWFLTGPELEDEHAKVDFAYKTLAKYNIPFEAVEKHFNREKNQPVAEVPFCKRNMKALGFVAVETDELPF